MDPIQNSCEKVDPFHFLVSIFPNSHVNYQKLMFVDNLYRKKFTVLLCNMHIIFKMLEKESCKGYNKKYQDKC